MPAAPDLVRRSNASAFCEAGANAIVVIRQVRRSPADVARIVGACILGKTDTMRDAEGFNPTLFLYSGDIDLCRKMKELGYRVVFGLRGTIGHSVTAATRLSQGAPCWLDCLA